MAREKWASLTASCTSGIVDAHSHAVIFLPWEKSWSKKFSLGAELCCLGEVMQVKSNSFFYPLQCNKIVFFFLQWYVGTSLLKNLDFHKGSFICGWLSKTAFFRGSWTMAQMGRSQFTDYFRIHSWNWGLCPYMGGQDSWVPWHMALDHTTPTKALLSMNGYLTIVVKGEIRWKMSYSAIRIHRVGILPSC